MTFGMLVGRFGAFVVEQAPPEASYDVVEDFSDDLLRVRQELNHHVIPLLMLARCDGETAVQERAAIIFHCRGCLREVGSELGPEEEAALETYLREFRPTRVQLDWAVKLLVQESHERVAALVAAAQAVVDADRQRRPCEAKFLAELADDLHAIRAEP